MFFIPSVNAELCGYGSREHLAALPLGLENNRSDHGNIAEQE